MANDAAKRRKIAADKAAEGARKKAFYHKQRLDAEAAQKRGVTTENYRKLQQKGYEPASKDPTAVRAGSDAKPKAKAAAAKSTPKPAPKPAPRAAPKASAPPPKKAAAPSKPAAKAKPAAKPAAKKVAAKSKAPQRTSAALEKAMDPMYGSPLSAVKGMFERYKQSSGVSASQARAAAQAKAESDMTKRAKKAGS